MTRANHTSVRLLLHSWLSRRWTSCVIALLAAALGAGLGHMLGMVVCYQRAAFLCDQFALRMQYLAGASHLEARELAKAMDRSPYPHCSDPDLSYMRMLLFHADYLNEIGRMDNAKLLCSALQGRISPQRVQFQNFQPAFILRDNLRIYFNPPPYQKGQTPYLAVQAADRLLVFRPMLESLLSTAPLRYSLSFRDVKGLVHGHGPLQKLPDQILQTPGKGYRDGLLYATRCSALSLSCATASIRGEDATRYGRWGILATTLSGAFLCALFPLLFSLFHNNERLMAMQLRQAVRAGQLHLAYMPVVDLRSRKILGAEALARWEDAAGRPVSPELFIQLAEKYGFIQEITRFVVERVLREFGEYLRATPGFRIGLNASAEDFTSDKFLPMLDASLAQAGVSPESLTIEVTESSTARAPIVRATIEKLRASGFRVYIDDFGSGYSSLAYLHELNANAIKIDKSFVQAYSQEAVSETILPQIVAMAFDLGLQVVVEGIETEQQVSYFARMEKPLLAQGWLFGPPVAAETFTDLYLQPKCAAERL